MTRSLVIYRGPSLYDPATIIRAVLVLKSSNVKTGDMAQLHILLDAVAPHTAQATGQDAAICGGTCKGGGCPLRPVNGGGCYVVTCQGPLSTWKATRNQAPAGAATIAHALAGRSLRLGAYGDPAALPAYIIDSLAMATGGRVTGYTHGWQGAPHLSRWCMASVETEAGARDAWSHGWRTFRMTAPNAQPLPNEIDCPSERITCGECLLCRGSQVRARSITIPAHGSRVTKALAVIG
jgi:hypothetical protein